jgi:hypothetical protein
LSVEDDAVELDGLISGSVKCCLGTSEGLVFGGGRDAG